MYQVHPDELRVPYDQLATVHRLPGVPRHHWDTRSIWERSRCTLGERVRSAVTVEARVAGAQLASEVGESVGEPITTTPFGPNATFPLAHQLAARALTPVPTNTTVRTAAQLAERFATPVPAIATRAPANATPVSILRRVKVPRKGNVTILLPYKNEPVSPTHTPSPCSRKRPRSPNRYKLPPELRSDPLDNTGEHDQSPVQLRNGFLPHQPFRHQLPYDFQPLDAETRRWLLQPQVFIPITKRVAMNTPGGWTFDDDDHYVYPEPPDRMTFGSGWVNPITFVRDKSKSIFAAIQNRLRRTNAQNAEPVTPAAAQPQPQDGGPSPKRRRLSESQDAGSQDDVDDPMEPGDPMDVDDPMDIDEPKVDDTANTQQQSSSPPQPNSATSAARRAVQFSQGKPLPRQRTARPSAAHEERSPPNTGTATAFHVTPKPMSPARYRNLRQFFDNDTQYGLPGLPSGLEIHELKRRELTLQRQERVRIEREEAEKERRKQQRAEEARRAGFLAPLGLRAPRRALITELSSNWDRRARAAPHNGRIGPCIWGKEPHRDSVALEPKDFSRMVPPSAWLNDNGIQATLACLATSINNAASVDPIKGTPKCVALSSLSWTSFSQNPIRVSPRALKRMWGMTPENFLDIDTVLIPVNLGAHWTLLVVRPSRRTIAYVDSFGDPGFKHRALCRKWVSLFLGERFVDRDWQYAGYHVPQQTNGYDCGMFVITNSIYLSLGLDPSSYSEDDMPLQRRRIAAMLLNGGFTGEFDLSGL